jgi:uridine kinase
MERGLRDEMLDGLAQEVGSVTVAHPIRVALDGRPASGKTMLADEIAAVLRQQGRFVIRASIESFLLPRAVRYRRGELSAEGNYYDSFDYDALKRVLLGPLGPGGNRGYRRAVYDKQTDTPLTQSFATAPADAALLFEGVFLMRPELVDMWDLTIFVSVDFEETVARARERDKTLYGSSAQVEHRFRMRYGPSQELYFNLVRPTDRANIVVHNDEPQMPAWDVRLR